MAEQVERKVVIGETQGGLRLDQALAELCPEFSRSRLASWIKAGQVTVNGETRRPRDAVAPGETVCIAATLTEAVAPRPQAIDLDIVFEDPQLLVINKPVGLVVHPGAGNPESTLQNALLHHDSGLVHLPRAGIVHRLDKETSGLLVVAKTLEAHTALVNALQAREVHREYEAVVHGVLTAGGSVDAPMDRHPVDRKKMSVREDGKEAVTHYRVIERFAAHTHVQVNLETGRTHQIRVHMAHIRHPLVGDPVYGKRIQFPKGVGEELRKVLENFRRQALHARKLAFAHPSSGETVTFEAPLPADMQTLLEALRQHQQQMAQA